MTSQTMSKEQQLFLKKLKHHKIIIGFFQFFLLFIFLVLWEASSQAHLINSFIFCSPSILFKTFLELWNKNILAPHIGITLLETFASFFLVVVSSILISILLWWNQTFSEVLEPYFVVLNSLPKSAMAPIFIVWLGNNMKTIIVTAISVAVFASIINLYTCFLSTDPDKLKLIRTLHGSRFDCLCKVVLPINFPSILSIWKVDIGLCLIGVVIGEFLAAKKGLGYLIIYGSQVYKMDWVILSIVILCIIAMGLYKCITGLEGICKKHM